ncbi:DUF916 and DUF3324 domain-containing protein [Companilactobacillus sp. DQM5]|uniref:DUF916 and DUF3324 domain-containing protein n=1 Tax=Companilactobacillus sp. DQM5 TaxID=3463359 RepID=UPI004059C904
MRINLKNKKILLTLFLLLGMKVITNQNTQIVNASGIDFQVGPVKSNKQLDKSVSYYDLKLKTNEQTEVKVQVKNNTNRVIHVDTYATSATTSDSGVTVYGKSNAKTDKSLLYQMSDIAKTNTPELTLQPNSVQTVSYMVKMPGQNYDGLLVGGINFVEKLSDIKQKAKGTMGVKNQYSYSEAIVLHGQTENSKGNLKPGQVRIGQVNYRNTFKAELINDQSNFVNQLKINQRIYDRDSNKLLYSTKKDMLQVAPNSKFKWVTYLNGDKFKPGKYKLVIDASATGNRKWHFEKRFDIKSKEAQKYNAKDVTVKEDYTWLYVQIGVIVFIFIIIIGILIRKRSIRKRKELEELKAKVSQLESDE